MTRITHRSSMKKRGTPSKCGKQARPAPKTKEDVFPSAAEFDRAISNAIREALIRHKRLGQTVYAWRDGRVVAIRAHDIRVPRKR